MPVSAYQYHWEVFAIETLVPIGKAAEFALNADQKRHVVWPTIAIVHRGTGATGFTVWAHLSFKLQNAEIARFTIPWFVDLGAAGLTVQDERFDPPVAAQLVASSHWPALRLKVADTAGTAGLTLDVPPVEIPIQADKLELYCDLMTASGTGWRAIAGMRCLSLN